MPPRTDRPGDFGGLDGCRAGWVLASILAPGGDRGPAPTSRSRVEVGVVSSFAEAIARIHDRSLAALAVDMPIGLPESGARAADQAARQRLGPRRSSVFPTPLRAVLDATDYPDALARSRAIHGRGLSKQAFNLLPKIIEVDAAMTPALQAQVVECHPEVAFARLAGGPLATTKHAPVGRAQRAALLDPLLIGVDGSTIAELAAAPPPGAKPDDVLDALVVALTARRLAGGRAEHLGDRARDARGLRMEIVV